LLVKIRYNFVMIANFPYFKHLALEDKEPVESIISGYEPYSDFNFTSLWSYNTNNELKVSMLYNNLVIELPDYLTSKPTLSVLGQHMVDETVGELLDYGQTHGMGHGLKLVPEVVVQHLKNPAAFVIKEDEDNHDYILLVDEVSTFTGQKYYDKRNLVNRFHKAHPEHAILELDFTNQSVHHEIYRVFDVWLEHSPQSQEESAIEKTAIRRLLGAAGHLDTLGLGCYVDNELVGFTIYEKSFRKYGFISFEKADRKFPGLYATLNHETAKKLRALGCEFINFEQDMGIPGLKQAKQLWRPVKFLRKYTISYK
jgi:hypothetical protein